MAKDEISVEISNIGGIDSIEQTFQQGVTILAGRNATNRTSLLQAVMAAFGSEKASLKADTDEGMVSLSMGGNEYTRTLTKKNGAVRYKGEPYLDDSKVADLFAFLIETNESRLAVPRGDDLREIIMRPMDTAAINAKIETLTAKKRDLDEDIQEIEGKKQRVLELEERLQKRRKAIDEKEAELAEKKQELEELDRDLKETKKEKSELDEAFSELRSARQEFKHLEYKLETEHESLESLEAEQADLEETWEKLEVISDAALDEVNTELEHLRETKQALESEVSTLQQVIQFNDQMLEGAYADIASTIRTDGGGEDVESVTDRLLEEDQEASCWTCGSEVQKSRIEDTLSELRSLLDDKHGKIKNLEREIEDIKSEKESIQSQQQRAEEMSRRRREVADEIEQRREAIAELQEAVDAQAAVIEELEAKVEALEEDNYSEILEKHKETNQVEFELDRLQTEVSDIQAEMESLESEIENLSELEAERESVTDELQEFRTKIDRLEEEAVTSFNDHMAEILEILGYKNIERIWLERTEREVREGRKKVTESAFELHIVRTTADGTVYEDTVDNLSESERQVTGLIFALAGYLVHDVHEVLPVMMLDSLEAIDADRIHQLIKYFEEYAEYLLVALLPEDAATFEGERTVIQMGGFA